MANDILDLKFEPEWVHAQLGATWAQKNAIIPFKKRFGTSELANGEYTCRRSGIYIISISLRPDYHVNMQTVVKNTPKNNLMIRVGHPVLRFKRKTGRFNRIFRAIFSGSTGFFGRFRLESSGFSDLTGKFARVFGQLLRFYPVAASG